MVLTNDEVRRLAALNVIAETEVQLSLGGEHKVGMVWATKILRELEAAGFEITRKGS